MADGLACWCHCSWGLWGDGGGATWGRGVWEVAQVMGGYWGSLDDGVGAEGGGGGVGVEEDGQWMCAAAKKKEGAPSPLASSLALQ